MANKELKIIADKMVSLREEKGVTIFEVAAAIGADPSHLKKMESCKEDPTELLDALSDYYGISISDFFGENQPIPEELADIGVQAISFSKDYQGDREMTPEKIEEYKRIVTRIKKDME